MTDAAPGGLGTFGCGWRY